MKKGANKKINKRWIIIIAVVSVIVVLSLVKQINDFKIQVKDKIAVVPLSGVIGVSDSSFLGESFVSSTDIVEVLEKIGEDDSIKAVILEINSPGGTVVASEEIVNAVKELDKPTVAWIREVGASGAYWVASATDVIVADPLSITGSIGVISSYLQFSDLLKEYGVEYERLVSGDYKDTGSPFKELEVDERRLLQGKINLIHEFFVGAVAENRNMTYEEVKGLSTGIFYLGKEAKELGLVDVLGGKKEAVEISENLAGIKDAELVVFEEEKTLLDLFGGITSNVFYYLGKGMGSNFDNEFRIEAIAR